jgi:hypothetical protein
LNQNYVLVRESFQQKSSFIYWFYC